MRQVRGSVCSHRFIVALWTKTAGTGRGPYLNNVLEHDIGSLIHSVIAPASRSISKLQHYPAVDLLQIGASAFFRIYLTFHVRGHRDELPVALESLRHPIRGMAHPDSPRHPLFRRRWFIITCVRWYLRFKLSYRDLAELARELGVSVAPSTILRWVIRYVPEFEKCWQAYERPVGDSWRLAADQVSQFGNNHPAGRWCAAPASSANNFRTASFWRREAEATRRL
jgi:hypothetical protein